MMESFHMQKDDMDWSFLEIPSPNTQNKTRAPVKQLQTVMQQMQLGSGQPQQMGQSAQRANLILDLGSQVHVHYQIHHISLYT